MSEKGLNIMEIISQKEDSVKKDDKKPEAAATTSVNTDNTKKANGDKKVTNNNNNNKKVEKEKVVEQEQNKEKDNLTKGGKEAIDELEDKIKKALEDLEGFSTTEVVLRYNLEKVLAIQHHLKFTRNNNILDTHTNTIKGLTSIVGYFMIDFNNKATPTPNDMSEKIKYLQQRFSSKIDHILNDVVDKIGKELKNVVDMLQ